MKRIFVIGKNRSGTKWVSNLVGNHPDIASIQREGAGGILESNLFSRMEQVFGPLEIDDNYIGFIECYSKTNFFKISKLTRKDLYNGPRSYLKLLIYILDKYTENLGKQIWVQKSDATQLCKLIRSYPEAKYITIIRDPVDNIRSTIALSKLHHWQSCKNVENFRKKLFRQILLYVIEKKKIERYKNYNNILNISYEDLRHDKERVAKKICGFLDIPFHESMLIDRYRKNTSFQKEIRKEEILNGFDILIVKLLYPILNLFPGKIYDIVYWVYLKSFRNTTSRFIPKTFDLEKEALNREGYDFEIFDT